MSDFWFKASDLRQIDILAVERFGMPSIVLMEHAAIALRDASIGLIAHHGLTGALILCGPGNNGGDGFALARLLANAKVPTRIIATREPASLTGDARTNAHIAAVMKIPIAVVTAGHEAERERSLLRPEAALIVDALLGTGLTTPATGLVADLIEWINRQLRDCVLAVDLPSGFHADQGPTLEPCVRADSTVTFVGMKWGFAHPQAAQFLGHVSIAEIGAPKSLVRELSTPHPGST